MDKLSISLRHICALPFYKMIYSALSRKALKFGILLLLVVVVVILYQSFPYAFCGISVFNEIFFFYHGICSLLSLLSGSLSFSSVTPNMLNTNYAKFPSLESKNEFQRTKEVKSRRVLLRESLWERGGSHQGWSWRLLLRCNL